MSRSEKRQEAPFRLSPTLSERREGEKRMYNVAFRCGGEIL